MLSQKASTFGCGMIQRRTKTLHCFQLSRNFPNFLCRRKGVDFVVFQLLAKAIADIMAQEVRQLDKVF